MYRIALLVLSILLSWICDAASGNGGALGQSKLMDKSMTFQGTTDYYRPNDCNALLRDGVFDEHDVFGSSFQQKVFLNRFCSADYKDMKNASDDSLSLGVPIGDLMASFGFSGKDTTFRTEYLQLCSQQDAYVTSNQVLKTQIRNANAALAHEFVQCVAGQPFSAYADPADGSQFQIIVNYNPLPAMKDAAKVTSFDYDHQEITCSTPGESIRRGGVALNCSRVHADRMALLALNTEAGKQSFRVPAYRPPPPALPPTSGIGDVVMSLLDSVKFAQQHPNEQWISCSAIHSGAKKAPAGTAWASLTGNADLPDCANRFPRATMTGGPVAGVTQDDQVGSHSHTMNMAELEGQGGHGFLGSGPRSNSANQHPPWNSAAGTNPGYSGDGSETRPKAFVLNFYIRVN